MIDWVQATGPRFLALRAEVKARRVPFRQMGVEWACPPATKTENRSDGV